MKPITEDDLIPGANLLCLFDDDEDVNNKWTGLIFTIDSVWMGRVGRPQRVCGKSPISGGQTSPYAHHLTDHDTFIFVNYDKMTDKEKFLFRMTGKVNLE